MKRPYFFRLVGALGGVLVPSLSFAEPSFTNLASRAKITASSQLNAQELVATAIADGRIAPALSQHFEFYPADKKAKSWAVDGEVAKDRGELVLEWPEAVMVEEIIYFGRTAWLLEECFKDYEILVDGKGEAVTSGSFEKRHGGQRVAIPRQKVKQLTLRFHNSHGGPNPGATEILVLEKKLSDEAVAALAPADPPTAERPPDPVAAAQVVWKSPSENASGAMPIGNGSLLANVWTDVRGNVRVSLAHAQNEGGAKPVGTLRFRLEGGLNTAEDSLRQSLRFKYGEVVIKTSQQAEKPVFSFFVDANRDVLHLQLRTAKPARLTVAKEGEGGQVTVAKDSKRLLVRQDDAALVILCDGMEPGADESLRTVEPLQAFDFQVHLVVSEEGKKLEDSMKAVAKTDVNGAVSGQMEAWNRFWNRGSIHLSGDDDEAAISRALVLRRYLSACSGRGPHPLKPPGEPRKEAPEREIRSWSAERSAAAIAGALESAKPYLETGKGEARFPHFWGADFSKLPERSAVIDSFMDTLRAMLLVATGKRACVLPGWPADRDVVARIDCETGLGVMVALKGGEIERLEVYPKQRTSEVFGIGQFEEKVREALPGPFRMPALISFLNPSWVGPRVGHDNLFEAMKGMHFNGLEGSLADVEATRKAGIFLLVHGVNPWTAHALKDEKHVISYYLSDRKKPGSFPGFGNMRRQYEAIDPYHPAEFTTYSQYGGIEFFLDVVRPRMLEYYDYHWQRQAHLHFHYLEHYRRMALSAGGIPIFRFVHVHDDNVVKMRQTVSMSLAYGVKGIKWWVGWTMFDIHKVVETKPPPLSAIGREVSGINNTMAAFSPSLVQARSVAVYHTEPLPQGTQKASEDYWVQPSGEHIVMGLFKGKRGEDFITLGNRDIGTKHKAILSFKNKKVTAVRQLDKKTRQWKELQLSGNRDALSVTIEVDRGDIELLQVVE